MCLNFVYTAADNLRDCTWTLSLTLQKDVHGQESTTYLFTNFFIYSEAC